MIKDTRGQLSPLLDRLSTASRKGFQQRLWKIHYSGAGREFLLASETVDEALQALEENARKWIADAVDDVSAASRTPEAFALINEALAAHVTDLQREAKKGILIATKTTILNGIVENRLSEIVRRLESQLWGYRDAFTGDVETAPKSATQSTGAEPFTDAERKEWINGQPRQNVDHAHKQFKTHPRYDGTNQDAFRAEWKKERGTKRGRPRNKS